MNTVVKLSLGMIVGLVSLSSVAAELLVTPATSLSKIGGRSVALDLVTDGNVSGFNFVVRLGSELDGKSVDVSKCLVELPKGFSGGCKQNKDGIYVAAMSNDASTLPAGVTGVGTIVLGSALAKGGAQVAIDSLVLINEKAETISSSHQVSQ
jgi:hypothetical protein